MGQVSGVTGTRSTATANDQGGHETSIRYCAVGAFVTALGYFFSANLGELLAFPSAPVSALWAPNAILLAALALVPARRWWLFLSAVFVAHFTAQLPIVPWTQAVFQFIANCAVALIGAAALRHASRGHVVFDGLRPTLDLIVFAGIVAPLSSSLVMALAFVATGLTDSFWLTTVARTVTNTFAILTLVPLIVNLMQLERSWRRRISWQRALEGALLVASLLVLGLLVFVVPKAGPHQSPSLLYMPFPALLWAAVRFSTSGVCASMLLLGGLSTWGVLHGNGPFVHQMPVDNALSVVFFLVVTSMPLLLLAGLLNERKKSIAALVESKAQHREAFELHCAVLASIEDQLAVLDSNGRVLEVNRAWRLHASLGLTPIRNALPGANYLDCLREGEHDRALAAQIAEAIRSVLARESVRHRFEYAVHTSEGVFWVEHSIERLMRPEGGAVLRIADATHRKVAEQEAHARHQQLAHLARVAALGEISGAIAHEVNQPLSAILGNAEAGIRALAGRRPNLKNVREILQDIVSNDLRAAEVIKRVRDMLRSGDGRVQPLSLNEIVSDVLKLLHNDLMRRAIRVETSLTPVDVQVEADVVQLQQVVLNLLMNACEAMNETPHENRRVHITTASGPEPGEIELVIRDFGPGLADGDCERIFRPFVTSKPQGLGLGLSISQSIVKAHGGRLWAERAESGARFRMVLRQWESRPGAAGEQIASPPAAEQQDHQDPHSSALGADLARFKVKRGAVKPVQRPTH